ncbi:MAG: NfeD family protein [Hyphomicrobiales bacterium]|nr:NfeD family protein [Hyphomicrobiales bacterium]
MGEIATLISSLGPWAWLALAALLIVLDIAAPGLFLLWFGAAAAATGLVLFAAPLSLAWQAALFSVFSVASLAVGRAFFSPARIETDQPLLNQRGAQLIGKSFPLDAPIMNGRGRIKVGDVLWVVSGPDLPEGAAVTVTAADSGLLTVEEAKKPKLPHAGSFG